MLTDAEAPTTMTSSPEVAAPETPAAGVSGGLRLEGLVRRFGSVTAVDGVSLEIPTGKLVSFLGPSGCGKTTLLRLIAGLDTPNSGRVLLDGVDMTSTPAHNRDIGMVFQSLALFPHLNVRRNIGYGLRIRKAEKAAIAERVETLLQLVDLDGLADRQVSQLSGGQRQRVAIARALARNPALFLLDEPMSALDANLRESLQVELRLLQQKLGITTIMVTHDQREAMTMSDIIVVLNDGRVEQVGPPLEVYRHPKTVFSATFLGSTNLLRGRKLSGPNARINGCHFELDDQDLPPVGGAEITLSARPAEITLAPADQATGSNRLPGTVSFIRDLGATFECFVDCGFDEPIVVQGMSRELGEITMGDDVVVHVPASSCVVVAESASEPWWMPTDTVS